MEEEKENYYYYYYSHDYYYSHYYYLLKKEHMSRISPSPFLEHPPNSTPLYHYYFSPSFCTAC